MESVLLSAHVLAGILLVGPVAVTASVFPRVIGASADAAADASAEAATDGAASNPAARVLHRITRSYGAIALVVPILGLLLAGVQDRLGEVWITLAMVLTALAGGLLALRIVPWQRDALAAPPDSAALRSYRALVGIFNLLWAAVVVLMIVRPGAR